jgi:hypothetical protein
MWTSFHDMHSGGDLKEDFQFVWIEAPVEEAKIVFYNRFGHSPDRVSCTCCGEDYSVDESETLEQATGYERNLIFANPADSNRGGRYLEPGEEMPKGWKGSSYSFQQGEPTTLSDFLANGTADSPFGTERFLVIRAEQIKYSEYTGELPEQGYVWVD